MFHNSIHSLPVHIAKLELAGPEGAAVGCGLVDSLVGGDAFFKGFVSVRRDRIKFIVG